MTPTGLHPHRWLIIWAVLMGTLVGVFGSSTVNVALPDIMSTYDIGINSAAWLMTIYMLCVAVLMPISGELGDRYGYKRIYLLGLVVFAFGSFMAAFSSSFIMLLAARILQGIGTSPTMPSIMGITTQMFPQHERGRALGIWATVNSAGHGLGPVLGGNLVQHFGWEAVFYLQAGLILIGIFIIWVMLPNDRRNISRSFDSIGAITLALGVLTLLVNLNQSVRIGWLSPMSIGLWVVSGFLFGSFYLTERRVVNPFVDLKLFTNRGYSAATLIFSILYFCIFGLNLVLPQFLIRVQGLPVAQAGLLIAPLAITPALMGTFAGVLADKTGYRKPIAVGMSLAAGAGIVMLFWNVDSPPWLIVLTLVLVGVGIGLTQSPTAAAATTVVEKGSQGLALGVFNMFRSIGASMGSTVWGVMLGIAPLMNPLTGYHWNFFILIGVTLLAALLATYLPQPPGSATTEHATVVEM
jgi:EmrB/QacA subfamily drug resistance transporter